MVSVGAAFIAGIVAGALIASSALAVFVGKILAAGSRHDRHRQALIDDEERRRHDLEVERRHDPQR